MPELICGGKSYSISVGREGIISAEEKQEGDGKTPIGTYRLRECWYRADRIQPAPATHLPLKIIEPNDSWCDDPKHELYNRHFKLLNHSVTLKETPFSFEHLWREDHAYDLIIPIGYNDEPVITGKGSAIFIHCLHDDGRATAGCVALKKEDLLSLLPLLSGNSTISIEAHNIILTP